MTHNIYRKFFVYIFVISINLHLLRNLIPFYEIIILVLLFATVIFYMYEFNFDSEDMIIWLWLFIILGIIYIILITFFQKNIYDQYIPIDQIIRGTSRIILMPMIMLILFPAVQDSKIVNGIIIIFISISLASVFSLIYQYYAGPISWFADPGSTRGINIRYASLHGSLTVSSTSLSIAILCSYFIQKNSVIRFLTISILIIGLILSLQKSSIINVVLIFLLIFLFSENKIRTLFFIALGSLITIYLFNLLKEMNSEMFIVSHLNSILYYTLDPASADSIDTNNLSFRLYGGAINIMNEYGWSSPLTGIGLLGAGASMGIDGGQAHNTFWDITFMGSFFFLMFFIISIIIIFKRNFSVDNKLSKLFIASNILFVINCFQGAILFFQPVTSIIFWLSMACSTQVFISRKKLLKNGK